MIRTPLLPLLAFACFAQTPDWPAINAETLKHFTAVVQMDTQDPPGNETKVVEYVKKTLEAEGIPVIVAAKDPARANLIARLKGNGSKRPLLIMGHTDTVQRGPGQVELPSLQRDARRRLYLWARHDRRQETT